MNAIIIYAATGARNNSRYQKLKYHVTRDETAELFVRCQFMQGFDAGRALDKAKPLPNETVLNSIEVP